MFAGPETPTHNKEENSQNNNVLMTINYSGIEKEGKAREILCTYRMD